LIHIASNGRAVSPLFPYLRLVDSERASYFQTKAPIMEKRKQKLGLQLDAIQDERNLVNENIQSIVNQISSYKENPQFLQPKDYPVLFSYELDVLKKLTEINYELESLIEAYPLKDKCAVLKMELKNEASNEQPETTPNLCDIPMGNNTTVSNGSNLPDRLVVNDLHILEHERLHSITDADIQAVRETVKEMSAKLGISQNMSAIKNYYEKPSSSHLSLSYPSSSRIEPENSNQFEIPEKDISPSNNNLRPPISLEESSVSIETEMESLQKDYNCIDVQNNDESTAENSICSSSPEQFSDYVDCLSNECNSGSPGSPMQKVQNSAVEKFNNYIRVHNVSSSNE
ncbi:unnamed protein product, partial [Callosobruchus maculatus]